MSTGTEGAVFGSNCLALCEGHCRVLLKFCIRPNISTGSVKDERGYTMLSGTLSARQAAVARSHSFALSDPVPRDR